VESLLRDIRATYRTDHDFNRQLLLLTTTFLRVEQRRYSEAAETFQSLETEKPLNVWRRRKVQYLRARLDAAGGRTGEARAAVEELVQEARGLRDLPLELEARLWQGIVLVESGDAAGGRTELAEVARRAHELGLSALAGRAERRLAE
jgi:hypothetical protein